MCCYTFDEDCLLASETGYYDRATVLRQLGILHKPDTTIGRVIAFLTPPFVVLRAYARRFLGCDLDARRGDREARLRSGPE